MAIIVAVASIVGRLDRSSPAGCHDRAHRPSPPDCAFIPGNFSPLFASEPRVLDLETGTIDQWPRLKDSRLQVTALSPWVDDAGRRQIVGRQVVEANANPEVMLARYLLPEARLLDRISPESPPLSPPCWDPSGVARILYVGLNRNLYRVDFGIGSTPASVSKIPWEAPGQLLADRTPLEISWFRGEDAGSYLIAAVSKADSAPKHRSRLWWLRLDAKCRAIEEAGPLIEPFDQEWYQESRPAISAGGDRPPRLAFLANRVRGESLDAFTAEIRADPTTRRPRIERGEIRLMSRGCAQWSPVFSPDGRHLYCLKAWEKTLRFTRHDLSACSIDTP